MPKRTESIDIDGNKIIVIQTSYTDAQKKAVSKYRTNNKDKVNEQRKKYYADRKDDEEFMNYKRSKAKEYYQRRKARLEKQKENNDILATPIETPIETPNVVSSEDEDETTSEEEDKDKQIIVINIPDVPKTESPKKNKKPSKEEMIKKQLHMIELLNKIANNSFTLNNKNIKELKTIN
jgi:preprotein translocase subunit SecD